MLGLSLWQRLLWLRIASRADWMCSKVRFQQMSRQKTLDLTATEIECALEWWQSGSDQAWQAFEDSLFAAVRLQGQQNRLMHLRTLDLASEGNNTHMDLGLVSSFFGRAERNSSRLGELSKFCPHLQHLRLPNLEATRLIWSDALLMWKGLCSLSLDCLDAAWKADDISKVCSSRRAIG
jgi:hypothetical protein